MSLTKSNPSCITRLVMSCFYCFQEGEKTTKVTHNHFYSPVLRFLLSIELIAVIRVQLQIADKVKTQRTKGEVIVVTSRQANPTVFSKTSFWLENFVGQNDNDHQRSRLQWGLRRQLLWYRMQWPVL